MQQGRVPVAISLYTAAILSYHIQLNKFLYREENLLPKKSDQSAERKCVEGDSHINYNENVNGNTNEATVEKFIDEEKDGNGEEEVMKEKEDVINSIDRLSSLYYSLGAAVLDCKDCLSLSLSLPPLLSSSTLTCVPNPSLHGSSSNWRKGHEIWKIGDKITKKWYKLHEKNSINDRSEEDNITKIGNENEYEKVVDMRTRYRNALTMQIEKLSAYDYSNPSNVAHTGGMDCDKYDDYNDDHDEIECVQNQKLRELNIHLSKGLISPVECERAINWAEGHAAALPLSLLLPLPQPSSLPSSCPHPTDVNNEITTCTSTDNFASSSSSKTTSSNGWTTSRHYAVPTTDLPVHVMPDFLNWFNTLMHFRIAPLMRKQFLNGKGRVSVHDAFIVKYEHDQPKFSSSPFSSSSISASNHVELGPKDGIKPSLTPSIFECLSHPLSSSQRHLPLHTDESTHSLIIAFNSKECYRGGGTYFADLNSVVKPGT